MKKLMVSLAAAPLLLSSVASADVDVKVGGQAVLYYQTTQNNGDDAPDMFDKRGSRANAGLQLNLTSDLGNGFTAAGQASFLGTLGLEKNLVSAPMQKAGHDLNDAAVTKIYIAKKMANTTVKLGRQELPKSLSPLAFSEGWNVFKNTFDAALVINSDIPKTVLVGAYVAQSNNHSNLGEFDSLVAATNAGVANVDGTAYMLTAQTKLIPLTTLTLSYYDLAKVGANLVPGEDIGASAFWADATIAGKEMPIGLNFGLQGGSIMPDSEIGAVELDNTTAYGIKAGIKLGMFGLTAAYTSVDGNDNKVNVAIKNTGTGIKTPLYTQMIANQNAIALDGDTFLLKAVLGMGDAGKVIAQGTMTSAGKSNLMNAGRDADGTDYTDFELIYKVKAAEVNFLAAYVYQSWDEKNANDMDSNNILRFWARYNF